LTGTEYKVMLVMTPSSERSRLESTLRDVGFALELADDGLFALTELERQKPDAIVCGNMLEDMTGHEFFEMLKDDQQLKGTGFVLMSGLNAQILGRGNDIQIPESTGAEDVVNFVSGLISKRDRSLARANPVPVAVAGLERPVEPPRLNSRGGSNPKASEFGGTLEHFSLFDLLMLLTQTGKTGLLTIRLRSQEARLLLEEGKLYHAEYEGEIGETVLIRVFMEAERTADSAFAFDAFETKRLPPEMQKLQSVYSPTDQLLLNVAIALDQHKKSGNL
jgi:CheY-like chemotaxis protein